MSLLFPLLNMLRRTAGIIGLTTIFISPLCSAAEDPIVISAGDQIETLSRFNHHFEMAMVLAAIREGVPTKSGVLINDLRERYLQARVKELLLLNQNAGYSLEVTRAEEDAEMSRLIEQAREIYGPGQADQATLAAQMEPLREYLREQLLIQKIRQALIQDAVPPLTSPDEESSYIAGRLEELKKKTGIQVWPDRLN